MKHQHLLTRAFETPQSVEYCHRHTMTGVSRPINLMMRLLGKSEFPRITRRFSVAATTRSPSSRFAQDIVEVYFQIVHTRFPLLNPEDFRSRYQSVSFISSDH